MQMPSSRAKVTLTKMSRVDRMQLEMWEVEKQNIRERERLVQTKKREAEEQAKRKADDVKRAERRKALEERISLQKEKIRAAMAERQQREEAYQGLLERTREYDPVCPCPPITPKNI